MNLYKVKYEERKNKILDLLDLIDGYPDRNLVFIGFYYLMLSKNMDISLFN